MLPNTYCKLWTDQEWTKTAVGLKANIHVCCVSPHEVLRVLDDENTVCVTMVEDTVKCEDIITLIPVRPRILEF